MAAKKDFVWKSLRISFWAMVAIFVLFMLTGEKTIINDTVDLLIILIWIVSVIFCFVVSIVHLTKYKEKAFAIVSLVISSIFVLLEIIGIIAVIISPIS